MKRIYKKIPAPYLPDGISLCMQNCKRYMLESEILEKRGQLQSSVVSLLIATEEFSKCKRLFDHYKNNEDFPEEEVKKYFSEHKVRLKEFQKSFLSSMPTQFFSEEQLEDLSKGIGDSDQSTKLNLMYVDWKGAIWHNPLKSIGFGFDMEKDRLSRHLSAKISFLRTSLSVVIRQISQDADYIKALKTLKNS